jgi:hypothetical protein
VKFTQKNTSNVDDIYSLIEGDSATPGSRINSLDEFVKVHCMEYPPTDSYTASWSWSQQLHSSRYSNSKLCPRKSTRNSLLWSLQSKLLLTYCRAFFMLTLLLFKSVVTEKIQDYVDRWYIHWNIEFWKSRRIQLFALWFIDGASKIDSTDPSWEIYITYSIIM